MRGKKLTALVPGGSTNIQKGNLTKWEVASTTMDWHHGGGEELMNTDDGGVKKKRDRSWGLVNNEGMFLEKEGAK